MRRVFVREATKTAVADLIVKFASHGESDPAKLKALVLVAPDIPSEDPRRHLAQERQGFRILSTRRFASSRARVSGNGSTVNR